MEKVAIIGADGQLGSDLRLAFQGRAETVGLAHSDIEITRKDSVDSCLNGHRPGIVVNTAACHDLNRCEGDPVLSFAINAAGARNLALWCRDNGALLVHVSTDYVFDGRRDTPYVEGDCPAPLNQYGITKLAGELSIASVTDRHAIVRTGGLYGTHPCRGKPARNFVEMFLGLTKGKEVQDFGGDEVNTPTFTEPLAAQLVALAGSGATGLFHATCEGACSWFEFGEEILRQTGSPTRLVHRPPAPPNPAAVKRPAYTVLENRRLKELGLDRMPDWREALRGYLAKRSP